VFVISGSCVCDFMELCLRYKGAVFVTSGCDLCDIRERCL